MLDKAILPQRGTSQANSYTLTSQVFWDKAIAHLYARNKPAISTKKTQRTYCRATVLAKFSFDRLTFENVRKLALY